MPEAEAMPAPAHFAILAVDYGEKTLGLAVGQTLTHTAQPLWQWPRHDPRLWHKLQAAQRDWRPRFWILGDPVPNDQRLTPLRLALRQFAETLQAQTQTPVLYIDERLTSVAARDYVAAKDYRLQKDAIAAALIAETWLSVYFSPSSSAD
jgi:putative Holliday junction resolvase